jgi:DNA-binding transcriptional regulator YhcF (GntR family)
VVAAYDQLLAQGLVEARKNRGFFVRDARAAPRPDEGGGRAAAMPRPAGR